MLCWWRLSVSDFWGVINWDSWYLSKQTLIQKLVFLLDYTVALLKNEIFLTDVFYFTGGASYFCPKLHGITLDFFFLSLFFKSVGISVFLMRLQDFTLDQRENVGVCRVKFGIFQTMFTHYCSVLFRTEMKSFYWLELT